MMVKSDQVYNTINRTNWNFPFIWLVNSRLTPDHVFYNCLTVFLERNSCITGVPFGRTKLSFCGNSTKCCALLRRGGPVGPGFQGMPDMFVFQDVF